MRFTSVFVLASLAVSGFASTVANVEADIETISKRLVFTNTQITAFPFTGGTLNQALSIHTAAESLLSAIKQGTVTASGLTASFTHAEGRRILDDLKKLAIKLTLDNLTARKDAFANLPLGGIFKVFHQDLTDLGAATVTFEQVLIKFGSKDLEPEAIALAADARKAFDAALLVFP